MRVEKESASREGERVEKENIEEVRVEKDRVEEVRVEKECEKRRSASRKERV